MAKFNLYFCLEGTDKTTFPALKRIKLVGDDTWYCFPEELQRVSTHTNLMKIPVVKNAISSMKTRGNFRNITLTFTEEIKKLYVDDDDNFVCGDYVLGEASVPPANPISGPAESSRMDSMVACLEKIAAPKQEPIKEILKHLLLEKFSQKNRNVESWCSRFEKESERFQLTGRRQIEVFKSCLDSSLNNWFVVTQENFPLDAEWQLWRSELISNFGDNSFRPICSAIGYRYMGGSYIDYLVNKEKLLIEANNNLPKEVILDLLVYGLPSHIIKVLNKKNITNIKILKDKLKKYEGEDQNSESFNKTKNKFNKQNQKNSSPPSFRKFDNKNNFSNVSSGKKPTNNSKKPCSICSAKGLERVHSESVCWFKDKQILKSVNNLEAESSATSSGDEQPKN